MSVYPAEVDTFPVRSLLGVIEPEHVNRLQAAVVAIQETLGVNPQGMAATVGGRLSTAQVVTAPAASALSSPRAVTFDEDGTIRYLDAANVGDVGRLVLVTMNSAAAPGDPVNVVGQGLVEWPTNALTPGAPLFLGRFGTLMLNQPTSVAFTQIIAYAFSESAILVDPQSPILF